MPHKPGHKKDGHKKDESGGSMYKGPGGSAGGSTYKGPGGSSGGSMSRGLPPLRRPVEPGFMTKAKTKPVPAKPTRYDNRRVAK